ncbi:putative reverse transcriptase domain-containing protein [Tanacetum coccineum]
MLCISSVSLVVETTLVTSPTRLCGLVPYSDSDSDSPDEIDSPDYITPLPATSPFLYIDSSKASDSLDGPPSQDPYVATVAHWRSRGNEWRKRVGPLPSFSRLEWRAVYRLLLQPLSISSSSSSDSSPVSFFGLDAPDHGSFLDLRTKIEHFEIDPRDGQDDTEEYEDDTSTLETRNGNDNRGGDGNGNDILLRNGNNEGDNVVTVKENRTEGVVRLIRWSEKLETVFHISNSPERYQMKYATCTLLDSALTWWNSHKRTIGTDAGHAYHGESCQNVARAYTDGNNKKRGFGGTFPFCNRCRLHHEGQSTMKCNNCNKVGHMTRDCKAVIAISTQGTPGPNQRVITYFEYGAQGHCRKDYPKVKNQNHGNKARVPDARGKTYVLGGGNANPSSNTAMGTFLLNDYHAYMLFDLGADRSFVSNTFSTLLDIIPSALDVSYAVELADGRTSETNTVLRGCTLGLLGYPFNIDLMPIDFVV